MKYEFLFNNIAIMDSLSIIEKEIKRGITYYIYHSVDSKNIINVDAIMKKIHNSRRINLTQDTFLNVCSYLSINNMITFATLCKGYIPYYLLIWDIIKTLYYPFSIMPSSNYLSIRQNTVEIYPRNPKVLFFVLKI
jgi:hypothetical protein